MNKVRKFIQERIQFEKDMHSDYVVFRSSTQYRLDGMVVGAYRLHNSDIKEHEAFNYIMSHQDEFKDVSMSMMVNVYGDRTPVVSISGMLPSKNIIKLTQDEYDGMVYYKENSENLANPLAQWLISFYKDFSVGDELGVYDGYDVDDQDDLIRYVNAWQRPDDVVIVGD